jgi:hypothetical protein
MVLSPKRKVRSQEPGEKRYSLISSGFWILAPGYSAYRGWKAAPTVLKTRH